MKQYIDKATVVAEIKRRVEAIRKAFNEPGILSGVDRTYAYAQYEAFKSLSPFLDTLETKDVELEKEIKEEYLKRRCYGGKNNMLVILNEPQFNEFAKHFFELGLKTQKGE